MLQRAKAMKPTTKDARLTEQDMTAIMQYVLERMTENEWNRDREQKEST